MSGKCQGFFNFQPLSYDENYKMVEAVFLTFWIQAKSF